MWEEAGGLFTGPVCPGSHSGSLLNDLTKPGVGGVARMFSPDSQFSVSPVKYFPGHLRERKWTISVSSETNFSPWQRFRGGQRPAPSSAHSVRMAGVGWSQEILSVMQRGGAFEIQACAVPK